MPAGTPTKAEATATSRRRASRRRPRSEWAIRGALALLVTLIGYCAVTFSFAQVVVKADPMRAHHLAPYDGRITARAAAALAGPTATLAERRRADALAVEAIRQDPTAIDAVTTLGVNAQVRGDTAKARRTFAFAERLSRRNLIVQLWAIEDSVQRGDVGGALRHYDTALRVKPAAGGIIRR